MNKPKPRVTQEELVILKREAQEAAKIVGCPMSVNPVLILRLLAQLAPQEKKTR